MSDASAVKFTFSELPTHELSRLFFAHMFYSSSDFDRYFPMQESSDECAAAGSNAMLRVIVDPMGHRAGDPHREGQDKAAEVVASYVKELLAM